MAHLRNLAYAVALAFVLIPAGNARAGILFRVNQTLGISGALVTVNGLALLSGDSGIESLAAVAVRGVLGMGQATEGLVQAAVGMLDEKDADLLDPLPSLPVYECYDPTVLLGLTPSLLDGVSEVMKFPEMDRPLAMRIPSGSLRSTYAAIWKDMDLEALILLKPNGVPSWAASYTRSSFTPPVEGNAKPVTAQRESEYTSWLIKTVSEVMQFLFSYRWILIPIIMFFLMASVMMRSSSRPGESLA